MGFFWDLLKSRDLLHFTRKNPTYTKSRDYKEVLKFKLQGCDYKVQVFSIVSKHVAKKVHVPNRYSIINKKRTNSLRNKKVSFSGLFWRESYLQVKII